MIAYGGENLANLAVHRSRSTRLLSDRLDRRGDFPRTCHGSGCSRHGTARYGVDVSTESRTQISRDRLDIVGPVGGFGNGSA